jgi:SSS family solute:Na+ symporter
LMLASLVIMPLAAISAAGGWSGVTEALAAQDPNLLSPWGLQGKSTAAFVGIVSFIAIGIPFMGVPQLSVRFMSARSEESLVTAMTISIVVLLVFTLGAVLTGMAGRALFPGLEDPETIFPLLSRELFSPVMTGVMMIAVLAAIMSTVDSLLILASSAVVRDFLHKIRRSKRSDEELARMGKWVTLFIGIFGVVFALNQSPLIFWFVLFAWSGLGAAFGPVLLCTLWYKPTNLWGAFAGMLGGFFTTMAWVVWFKPQAYELLEIVPGFFVGLLLTVSVSLMTRERAPTPLENPI